MFELFSALDRLPTRPITETDPQPISIVEPVVKGDSLYISGKKVLCVHCNGIVQGRYLSQHISSGACSRQQERKIK